jgi:hypothetical protein
MGKANSCSILEAFSTAKLITGPKMNIRHFDENRVGDHICYYSDLRCIPTTRNGKLPNLYERFLRRSLIDGWTGAETK